MASEVVSYSSHDSIIFDVRGGRDLAQHLRTRCFRDKRQ